jgi:hypothetical protein
MPHPTHISVTPKFDVSISHDKCPNQRIYLSHPNLVRPFPIEGLLELLYYPESVIIAAIPRFWYVPLPHSARTCRILRVVYLCVHEQILAPRHLYLTIISLLKIPTYPPT